VSPVAVARDELADELADELDEELDEELDDASYPAVASVLDEELDGAARLAGRGRSIV
jgi:hypothetical protein